MVKWRPGLSSVCDLRKPARLGKLRNAIRNLKINLYSSHKIQGEFAIEVKKIESISKQLKN